MCRKVASKIFSNLLERDIKTMLKIYEISTATLTSISSASDLELKDLAL